MTATSGLPARSHQLAQREPESPAKKRALVISLSARVLDRVGDGLLDDLEADSSRARAASESPIVPMPQ